MPIALIDKQEQLLQQIEQLKVAPSGTTTGANLMLNTVDVLSRSDEGLSFLYRHIQDIVATGVFEGTVYSEPQHLRPNLVLGTLMGGYPFSLLEILSELRMLAIANGLIASNKITSEEAFDFLEKLVIENFDLAYGELSEENRIKLTEQEQKRIPSLFQFVLNHLDFNEIKRQLAKEIETLGSQRRITVKKLENILAQVQLHMNFKGKEPEDKIIAQYVNALFHPTERCRKAGHVDAYLEQLRGMSEASARHEAEEMGRQMRATGLVSDYHFHALQYAVHNAPSLIPRLLSLNAHGKVEWQLFSDFITRMIIDFINIRQKQTVYSLARLLEKNFVSRKPVRNGLATLFKLKLNGEIIAMLRKSIGANETADPNQILVCGVIQVLGQPLGISQGNNPTCQSARGISMWSQHSPGKLLDMIATVAASNELDFRYEGELIHSTSISSTNNMDYKLDPVSVILVPHLDYIYGQMMQRAMLKHYREDPHVSVNPAFYGHWIQTGFASCYDPLFNSIREFDDFIRTFYASFHPEYNGDNRLVYPVPLGIFITSSQGEFLGFHAISLLRVQQDPFNVWRAYFFNPNSEGRQDWGQGISPTVFENGEKPGESSLPFYQLAARIYAFHYNSIGIQDTKGQVPKKEIQRVRQLATSSWGKKYLWQ